MSRTSSRYGALIAHAWLYGGGVVGFAAALAVCFSVPVTSDVVAASLGVGGVLVGFLVGGWTGIEHEDRYERRRLGLDSRRPQ